MTTLDAIDDLRREIDRLGNIVDKAKAACSVEGQNYGYTSNAYAAAVKWRQEAETQRTAAIGMWHTLRLANQPLASA